MDMLLVGTWAAAVGGAGAATVAYQEDRRDTQELASKADLEILQETLREVHARADLAHRRLVEIWGAPLLLFDKRAELSAMEAGVSPLAVACVLKAQRLAEEAAALADRADVYETQLGIAIQRGMGLLRCPVSLLVEQLSEMHERLEAHGPFLQHAREAFARPRVLANERSSACSSDRASMGTIRSNSLHTSSSEPDVDTQMPMRILRERSRFGLAYRSMRCSGDKLRDAGKDEMDNVWMRAITHVALPAMRATGNKTFKAVDNLITGGKPIC